jgi:short-subunit dehydrogenase
LGLALTRAFVQRGARVHVIARNRDAWEQTPDSKSTQITFVAADLTNPAAARQAIESIIEQNGGIDWLVNNVGASTRMNLADGDAQSFADLMTINFLTAVNATQAALHSLRHRRGGVINIASLAARTPWPWIAPYVTSKSALLAYSNQLRFEIPELATVLTVLPGPIRREDSGVRYAEQAAGLPDAANAPGAGAPIQGLDPNRLADMVVSVASRGKRELVVPAKARLLFGIACLFPRLGDWLARRLAK